MSSAFRQAITMFYHDGWVTTRDLKGNVSEDAGPSIHEATDQQMCIRLNVLVVEKVCFPWENMSMTEYA